jgi:glycosyltransferase involved in cell wall biosynthesis
VTHLAANLSIVIPVYNSAESLPHLIKALEITLPTLAPTYEVVMVNDGSRDNSWQVVEQLTQQYSWVRGINLMRNYGQHNALLCGIRAAQYDIIVTMDDDLQHPPSEIHILLEKLNEGYDVVYGAPQKERHGLWRDFASQITKLAMQNAMGIHAASSISAFRAFRTHISKAFEDYNDANVLIDVLLTWGTTRFSAVHVRHETRRYGVSNYTVGKLIRHALNMITGFSVLPLQFASITGLLFTLFGILVFVYAVVNFFVQGGQSVPGFTFLASVIAIFSGVQLFALGIIGEYLARMHYRLMRRPSYTIKSTSGES